LGGYGTARPVKQSRANGFVPKRADKISTEPLLG
jgi:hypothetical protein